MGIRQANENDLDKIIELNQKLFDLEYDNFDQTTNCKWPISESARNFYLERITGQKGCVFVAEEDGGIVGYLAGSIAEPSEYRNAGKVAELDDMFVEEEYRNRQIGKKLMNAFLDWCKSAKVKRIKVLVTALNKRGIDFYLENCFKEMDVILEREI